MRMYIHINTKQLVIIVCPDSESTDHVSLEDQEEEDINDETLVTSSASTPSDPDRDFMPRTPDKVSKILFSVGQRGSVLKEPLYINI